MSEADDFVHTRTATETGSPEAVNAFHEGQRRAMISAADAAEQNPQARTKTITDNPHPAQETSDAFNRRVARARRGLSK